MTAGRVGFQRTTAPDRLSGRPFDIRLNYLEHNGDNSLNSTVMPVPGGVAAGDLVLPFMAGRLGDYTLSVATAGYSRIGQAFPASSANAVVDVFAKTAEGGADLTGATGSLVRGTRYTANSLKYGTLCVKAKTSGSAWLVAASAQMATGAGAYSLAFPDSVECVPGDLLVMIEAQNLNTAVGSPSLSVSGAVLSGLDTHLAAVNTGGSASAVFMYSAVVQSGSGTAVTFSRDASLPTHHAGVVVRVRRVTV